MGSKLLVSAVAGLVAWPVVRFLTRARRIDARGIPEIIQWTLLPALAITFASDSLKRALAGSPPRALVWVLAVCAGLCVALLFVRTRPRTRGSWVVWLPVLAAVLLAGHACVSFWTYGSFDYEGVPPRRAEGRPPIFLIVLDTVRADHLRCYGYSRDTMPALERWASGGLTATRAISPSGWTAPAHASIFSGRTVSGHGIHYRSTPATGPDAPMATPSFEGVSWLPEMLRAEGYHCLAVSANPLALPSDITGFDRVVIPGHRVWPFASVAARADGVSPLARRVNEWMRWRMPYVDARGIVDVARRAVPDDDRPLFLFVNFLDAHSPYNPPAAALRELGVRPGHAFPRYQLHRETTRLWGSLPDGKAQYVADLYDGELRWLDMNLESFLPWIDERYGGGAIVIVTSDHGEELGEEGRVGHEYGLPQRVLHVPLFVRGPGLAPGTLDDVVSLRSLFGFIHSCARGNAPDVEDLLETDGRGLISERYPSVGNAEVLGRDYARPWVSVIDGEYKAVGPSHAGLEFYDIEAMGFDREVPASDSLAQTALAARIDEYWEEFQDRRAEAPRRPSAGEVEALRSLGYLE